VVTAALVTLEAALVMEATADEPMGSGDCSSGGFKPALVMAATADELIGSWDCSSGGFGACAGDSSGDR